MGARTGWALRGLQFFVRAVEFCCAAIVLGIFSYFLATLHNHSLLISNWVKAVEGISGVAVIHTALAFFLLCCIPGNMVLSFILMFVDLCFAGAFIYVAVANRAGSGSCNGIVNTPYGIGNASTNVVVNNDGNNSGFTALPSLHQACKLQTASLAVAIVSIFFYLISAILQWALARYRQREKRLGNEYTSGYNPKKHSFFGRPKRHSANIVDPAANPNALTVQHAHPDDLFPRTSFATDEQTRVGTSHGPDGLNNFVTTTKPPVADDGGGLPTTTNTAAAAAPPNSTTPYYPHPADYHQGGPAPPPPNAAPAANYPPANYRYDDGVYDRAGA